MGGREKPGVVDPDGLAGEVGGSGGGVNDGGVKDGGEN